MYSITNHGLQRLKERGIVPMHFTCKDINRFLASQINQTWNEQKGKNKIVTKNNAVLVIIGQRIVTGYWNRRMA